MHDLSTNIGRIKNDGRCTGNNIDITSFFQSIDFCILKCSYAKAICHSKLKLKISITCTKMNMYHIELRLTYFILNFAVASLS